MKVHGETVLSCDIPALAPDYADYLSVLSLYTHQSTSLIIHYCTCPNCVGRAAMKPACLFRMCLNVCGHTCMSASLCKCLVCLGECVRVGHRMCYCLRGRSSSCWSWGCFLPSTHFPVSGRLGGISQTLCFVSSPCFLIMPPYFFLTWTQIEHTEQPEDVDQ